MSSVHWAIPLGLVVCWLFYMASMQCHEGPNYWGLTLAITVFLSVFWTGWFSVRDVQGWSRYVAFAKVLLSDLIILFLICSLSGFLLLILMPAVQCYAPRARVSELLMTASPFRSEIAQRILQRGSLDGAGKGLSIAPAGRLSGSVITDGGRMMLFMAEPSAAAIYLEPRLEDGEVKWKCTGFPKRFMPASCREAP